MASGWGSNGDDETHSSQWSSLLCPLWILLGVFSWGLSALYLLGRIACLLEATFASQKLEEEGVNMANLVREIVSFYDGWSFYYTFLQTPLLAIPSDNKTTICRINRNSRNRAFLATSLSEVLCLLAWWELEEAFKLQESKLLNKLGGTFFPGSWHY